MAWVDGLKSGRGRKTPQVKAVTCPGKLDECGSLQTVRSLSEMVKSEN